MVSYSKLRELSFLVYGLGLTGKSVIKFFKKNKIKKFKVWDDNNTTLFKNKRAKNIAKTLNDVDYINDSKATNINSVIVAIKTYSKPIILILGGYNKGSDFRLLLPHIKSSCVRMIISYGEAGGQINTVLGDAVRSLQVTDLSSAVKKAHNLAAAGDTILLSPGCASFDQFSNFEERGNHFKNYVNNHI